MTDRDGAVYGDGQDGGRSDEPRVGAGGDPPDGGLPDAGPPGGNLSDAKLPNANQLEDTLRDDEDEYSSERERELLARIESCCAEGEVGETLFAIQGLLIERIARLGWTVESAAELVGLRDDRMVRVGCMAMERVWHMLAADPALAAQTLDRVVISAVHAAAAKESRRHRPGNNYSY